MFFELASTNKDSEETGKYNWKHGFDIIKRFDTNCY